MTRSKTSLRKNTHTKKISRRMFFNEVATSLTVRTIQRSHKHRNTLNKLKPWQIRCGEVIYPRPPRYKVHKSR